MTLCFKRPVLKRKQRLSVSEIAPQLKFTNRTHFYYLFRKKVRHDPQEWRRHQAESSAK